MHDRPRMLDRSGSFIYVKCNIQALIDKDPSGESSRRTDALSLWCAGAVARVTRMYHSTYCLGICGDESYYVHTQ